MVFAGSRFATLTATSCSSVDQGKWRGSDTKADARNLPLQQLTPACLRWDADN